MLIWLTGANLHDANFPNMQVSQILRQICRNLQNCRLMHQKKFYTIGPSMTQQSHLTPDSLLLKMSVEELKQSVVEFFHVCAEEIVHEGGDHEGDDHEGGDVVASPVSDNEVRLQLLLLPEQDCNRSDHEPDLLGDY